MSLTTEQQIELALFPAVLRALVEEELAVGNSIVEVGHCFPAPPAGAYFKLANKVTTRPRDSGGGIDFYDYDNSSYSGQFTDAKRFFYILEPPNPPPPYPDMDAIRKAAEGESDALTQFAQRQAGDGLKIGEKFLREHFTEQVAETNFALTSTETSTSVKRVLNFQDKRPPHEIQFNLERQLMTLFTASMDYGYLVIVGRAKVVGADYDFVLRFESALANVNYYSICVITTWSNKDPTNHDYYLKTSDSWFKLWTRDFQPANPPKNHAGSAICYEKLCDAALQAEPHLDTVPAIQKTILDSMKQGAGFATAHKEGGSNIRWLNGTFTKTDYGDDPDRKTFSSDEELLKFLRQFYDHETSKNIYPEKVSDFVAWKLILRLLRTQ